ncbi:MAG TPA: hypothetical protein VEZ72_20320 [Paenibacillus sp.]|nr:hypothetical protein [Paenibacillus sp.]
MKVRIALLTAWSALLVLLVPPTPAQACSPAPWTFEEALRAKAMVYGKVAKSDHDQRAATVEVLSYVGPGEAPRLVQLPGTKDSRAAIPDPCPDFSMTFEEGSEYVFFLSDIPPNLQLLEPQWRTASLVASGQLIVGMPRGETDALKDRLRQFAEAKGYEIQVPNRNSPVWETGNHWIQWPIFIILVVVGVLLGFIFFLFRKRN